MHPQMIKAAVKGNAYRIVQVFGILPVDGNHQDIPQVFPAFPVLFTDILRHTLCLVQQLFREFHRELITLNDRHNIHAGVVDMSQNLCHFSLGTALSRAVIRNLSNHLMSCHCALGVLFWNKDISSYFPIIRHKEPIILTAFLISPHHLRNPSGDDFNDLRLSSSSGILRQQGNLNHILVKSSSRFVLRYEKVLLPPFYLHKAETLSITDKSTGKYISVAFHVFPANGLHQLTFRYQLH